MRALIVFVKICKERKSIMKALVKNADGVTRRVFAAILALLLAVAMVPAIALNTQQANAATSDGWMMSYDLSGGGFTYTYVLAPTDTEVYIQVGPATLDGSTGTLVPSYFSDQDDADAFALGLMDNDPDYVEFMTGDGLSAGTVVYADSYTVSASTDWAVEAVIDIPDDDTYGSQSVKITNPEGTAPNNYLNITIVRNEAGAPTPDTVANVDVWVFDPADDSGRLHYSSGTKNILSNTYYENDDPSYITYPTGFDALFATWYNSTIPELTSIRIALPYTPWIGDFVYSMTVAGEPYATVYDGALWSGWFSALYRNDTASGEYERVEIGERIGGSSYACQPGDIIVWKYFKTSLAAYDEVYNSYFHEHL
jgi:hypothetical protein